MKTVSKIIGIFCLVAIFATQLFAQQKEERALSSFNKINVSGGIDIVLTEGDKEMVLIEAKGIDLDKIITEVNQDELKIKLKDGKDWGWGWGKDTEVKVYVTYKTLQAFRNSGSSDVVCNSVIKSENFELKMSGSGDFKGEIATKDLTLSISGSADVYLKGKAEKQEVAISGSGNLEAKDLEGKTVKVSISGSGDAKVWASESIDAKVSGSGDIDYKGNPAKVVSKVSGSGTISSVN